MRKYKVYADTSVFGGCFDSGFSEESNAFFQFVIDGFFKLYLSTYVIEELQKAPPYVKEILKKLPNDSVEFIEFDDEVDFIVSWNFKHIVHFDKINGFNAVNLLNGYRKIDIYSPKQVI